MSTTRRGFLSAALAVLAAPAAAMGAKRAAAPAGELEEFVSLGCTKGDPPDTQVWAREEVLEAQRLKNAIFQANLDEAYKRANPLILVSNPDGSPRYEWRE